MNLVVVSNRLPFAIARDEAGDWKVEPGSGGLVTARRTVRQNHGRRWTGLSRATKEQTPDLRSRLAPGPRRCGYDLVPVSLSAKERDGSTQASRTRSSGRSSTTFAMCNLDPSYWSAYEAVNRKFAESVARTVRPDDSCGSTTTTSCVSRPSSARSE